MVKDIQSSLSLGRKHPVPQRRHLRCVPGTLPFLLEFHQEEGGGVKIPAPAKVCHLVCQRRSLSLRPGRPSAGRRVTPDTPKVVSGGTPSLPSRRPEAARHSLQRPFPRELLFSQTGPSSWNSIRRKGF